MLEHALADQLEIHPSRRGVRAGGRSVDIGSRAFDLLLVLFESRDRVVPKRELLKRAWPGLVVEENTLQAQISLLRKKLGAGSIATVAGRGYRLVAPVVSISAEDADAPATGTEAANLPAFGGRFVGRAAELAELLTLLDSSAVLTLTGIGGTGKTRLAVELARALAEASLAVWFVDLSSVTRAEQIGMAIAVALGVRDRPDAGPLEGVRRHLQAVRGTLVLDNCEHVSDEVAAVIGELGPRVGGLRILATSRQPLRLRGEQVYLVRPLSMPVAHDLAAAAGSEAVRLFVDRTRLIDPGFVLDDSNAAAVGEVCRRLDGIPLAIELAAARMKLLSVHQLRARLDERFKLLIGGSSTLARQQTLRDSMQWSYELLDPAAQRTLRALTVFSSGWTLESASAVSSSGAECSAGDELDTLERLTILYDKSLLVVTGASAAGRRYGMLQTVHQYAREKLLDPVEQAQVQLRHRRHFTAWVGGLVTSIQAPLDAATIGRLREEQGNLLAALEYSLLEPEGSDGDALRLAGSLWPFWLATAQLEQGYYFTSRALGVEAGPCAPEASAERALALLGLGNIEYYRGRYREALSAAEACLLQAREIGLPLIVGFAHKLRAGGHHALGDDSLALHDYQATLEIAEANGQLALQASALNNLAEVHRGLGDLAAAEHFYARAAVVGRRSGELDKLAFVMCNLARLYGMTHRLQPAAEALREAHDIAVRQSLRSAGDDVIDIAAGLASLAGDHRCAAYLYGASESRMKDSGSQREPVDEAFLSPLLAATRRALGEAAFESARADGAEMGYEEAMHEVEQAHRRWACG